MSEQRMTTFLKWSRWFERGSDNRTLGAPELALMANIAGWADSTGGGWGIDNAVLSSVASRCSISVERLQAAVNALEITGMIELKEIRPGLSEGQINFGAKPMTYSKSLLDSKIVRGELQ